MRFSVLSSGSRANCTFVEAASGRFLIDCGLSCRQIEQRLRLLGIPPETIAAIIITHEHADHIYGAGSFSLKYRIPVYVTEETGRHLPKVFEKISFQSGKVFDLCGAAIHSFSILHDAIDPVGFRIESEGAVLAHVTDLGKVTGLVREHLQSADALLLESNHDVELLATCSYAWPLKQRIASSHGHISNTEAGLLLADVMHDRLATVVLGHISENSNTPQAATETVSYLLGGWLPENFLCACVREATPLYAVGPEISVSQAIA